MYTCIPTIYIQFWRLSQNQMRMVYLHSERLDSFHPHCRGIPATVLRIPTLGDRKFPFPWDCNGSVGALKVSFIIIRSDVVVPELSLKFTSSAGVVAAVAINYSCFGCRAQAFITICAICKPLDCFNKELVRCLSGLRQVLIVDFQLHLTLACFVSVAVR